MMAKWLDSFKYMQQQYRYNLINQNSRLNHLPFTI